MTILRESAGGIIINSKQQIVLVFQNGNSWSFPKGGVEKGESTLEAARREIFEETGLWQVEYVRDLGWYERYSIGKDGRGETKEWGLRKRHMFLFRSEEEKLQSHDEEITKTCWVSFEEALVMLTHSKDREFLESIRYALFL